jgi:hypothetical protein
MTRVTNTRRAHLESVYAALQDFIDERDKQPTASEVGAMVGRPGWVIFRALSEMAALGWIERGGGRIELRGIK